MASTPFGSCLAALRTAGHLMMCVLQPLDLSWQKGGGDFMALFPYYYYYVPTSI